VRLVILNQFFHPDHSATSQLMTDLAESLVSRGLDVTAVAGRGRYNGGETLPSRGEYRGVKIERAWATGFGKRSVAARLSDYLSFYVGATWELLKLPRHDVVMVLTTPPLIGVLALAACRLRGVKLVALVQDVYPDVAVALGALKADGLATRAFDRLNRLVLRRASRVIALGDCMREVIVGKIGAAVGGRVDVIHNWADGKQIGPIMEGEGNEFAAEHGLGGRFVVLFSGNFGRVNDFATPLEAALILRGRDDIQFLFVGDGAKAGELAEFARAHALGNVRVLPYQPRERLRQSLAAGDAHLVTLAPGLAGLSVPSKTYGILAAARPVIFVGDPRSDAARLVAENGCGEVVPTGDAPRLAAVVERWAAERDLCAEMGRRARALFEQRFERAHAVDAYVETLRKCLGDDAGPRGSSEVVPANQEN
jgi:glycosyltransferase involved in cell wall biosynthesis